MSVFKLARTLLVIACAFVCAPSAHAQETQNDPRAVAAVERMLERMGGRDEWAQTRSLFLEYRVWRTDPDETLTERAWRDLGAPNQRIELSSPSAPVTWVFTADSGWVFRNGETQALSEPGLISALAFWPYDFYTMIRRLAVNDAEIVLAFEEPRRVLVRSRDGANWGWWEIDAHGNLVKWGSVSDGETLEYVYGPMKRFGRINFPAWGAAVDGSWRFEYAAVAPSAHPIRAAMLRPATAG